MPRVPLLTMHNKDKTNKSEQVRVKITEAKHE